MSNCRICSTWTSGHKHDGHAVNGHRVKKNDRVAPRGATRPKTTLQARYLIYGTIGITTPYFALIAAMTPLATSFCPAADG